MLGGVVILMAFGGLTLLVTAPLLPPPIAGVIYAIGSLVCHQLPDRSFHLEAFQLPVCARCTGIYAGAAAGAIGAVWAEGAWVDALMRPPAARRLLLAAAMPTLLTLVIEQLRVWVPSNGVRGAAGLLVGIAVAFVCVRALQRSSAPSRRVAAAR